WKRIGKSLPASKNKIAFDGNALERRYLHRAQGRSRTVENQVMRASRVLLVLVALSSLSVYLLVLRKSSAQDAPVDPSSAGNTQKQEKATDNATLNLHRWGAVTLFH